MFLIVLILRFLFIFNSVIIKYHFWLQNITNGVRTTLNRIKNFSPLRESIDELLGMEAIAQTTRH